MRLIRDVFLHFVRGYQQKIEYHLLPGCDCETPPAPRDLALPFLTFCFILFHPTLTQPIWSACGQARCRTTPANLTRLSCSPQWGKGYDDIVYIGQFTMLGIGYWVHTRGSQTFCRKGFHNILFSHRRWIETQTYKTPPCLIALDTFS